MLRGYIGDVGSQIHYRYQAANADTGQRPLIALPPAPHSGLYYKNVIETLAKNRDVYAVDYPGYGGSDPLSGAPTIEDYVQALAPALGRFASYDLMGFHTGCLMAVEIALQYGHKGNMVLVDIPYLTPGEQKTMGAKFEKPAPTPKTISDLKETFDMQVTNRLKDLPLERGVELWVETIRAGTGLNAAFSAAFRYKCVEKFASLEQPVHILATASPLNAATNAAADAMPNATLVDLPKIDAAVFEKYAADIASAINDALMA